MQNLKLEDFLKREGLNSQEKDGLILFNYSQKIQNDFDWDEISLNARGIVFEKNTGKLIARSFKKFFNYEELHGEAGEKLPKEFQPNLEGKFKVLEKMDGCLHFNTPIMLPNGEFERIGNIVKNKNLTHVMGYEHETNEIKPVKILNFFKNGKKDNWKIVTTTYNWSNRSGGGSHGTNKIRITANHKFYTNNGYVPLNKLKTNDEIYCKEIFMSDKQKSILLGSLLADSSISFSQNKKRAVLQGFHKKKHKEYVELKKHVLGDLCINTKYERISGFGTNMIPYTSINTYEFGDLKKQWYPNGKKDLPDNLDWFNEISFAFMYMDNGSLSHHDKQNDRLTLSMNYLSKKSCENIANKIREIFKNINLTMYNAKGWNIRINYDNGEVITNLWKSIYKYFPVCMQYKLPEKYRTGKPSILLKETFNSVLKLRKEKILKIANDISKDSALKNSKCGYDLETETHNFFAGGILVHNSLGICYKYNSEWRVNTRGSFESEQAIWATKFLQSHIRQYQMNPEYTYLFEIIYPENRIVVDYGKKESLTLLAIIETATGRELDPWETWKAADDLCCDIAKSFDFENFEDLFTAKEKLTVNEEGYVITFDNGYKCKLKGEEYCKVHRILSSVTPLHFWRAIDLETLTILNMDDVLLNLPEEFKDTAKQLIDITEKIHRDKWDAIKTDAEKVPSFSNDRDGKKERYFWLAENVKDKENVGKILSYLDGKTDRVKLVMHRDCRPTNNTYANVKLDKRLQRIIENMG